MIEDFDTDSYSTYPPTLVEQSSSVASAKSEKEEDKNLPPNRLQLLANQLKGDIGKQLISSLNFTNL